MTEKVERDAVIPVNDFVERVIAAELKKKLNHPFEFKAFKDGIGNWESRTEAAYRISLKMEIDGETVYIETCGHESIEGLLEMFDRRFAKRLLRTIHATEKEYEGALLKKLKNQLEYRSRFEGEESLGYLDWTERTELVRSEIQRAKNAKEALAGVNAIDLKALGTPKKKARI